MGQAPQFLDVPLFTLSRLALGTVMYVDWKLLRYPRSKKGRFPGFGTFSFAYFTSLHFTHIHT